MPIERELLNDQVFKGLRGYAEKLEIDPGKFKSLTLPVTRGFEGWVIGTSEVFADEDGTIRARVSFSDAHDEQMLNDGFIDVVAAYTVRQYEHVPEGDYYIARGLEVLQVSVVAQPKTVPEQVDATKRGWVQSVIGDWQLWDDRGELVGSVNFQDLDGKRTWYSVSSRFRHGPNSGGLSECKRRLEKLSREKLGV